jgi:uncharacterized membrane protein YgcG
MSWAMLLTARDGGSIRPAVRLVMPVAELILHEMPYSSTDVNVTARGKPYRADRSGQAGDGPTRSGSGAGRAQGGSGAALTAGPVASAD